MKYKVSWTITGEYEVSSSDLDIEDTDTLEEAKEIIGSDPWEGVEPTDGKLTFTVEEVK